MQQHMQQVLQQMSSIISEHEPPAIKSQNNIQTVSVEQAIQELLDLQKQLKP